MGPLVAFLVGMLTPSPSYGELKGKVRGQSTRYAAALPAQVVHSRTVGLQRSITGRTGSEDWSDQAAAGARSEGVGLPAVTEGLASLVPWPVGMRVPHLPAALIEGRGTGYVTGAYPKGWILVSQAGRPSWGGSAGLAARRPIAPRDTLVEPTDRTPAASAMQDAYGTANKGRTRLSDGFGD